MKKNILVCIDGSEAGMNALNYVGGLFAKGGAVSIDLFHILPGLPPLLLDPGENMAEMVYLQGLADQVEEENRRKGEAVMAAAREALMNSGVDPSRIRTFIKEPSLHVARDILAKEQETACRGIVLGRHGMSAVEEFLMGGVTHKILQHAKGVPICVVHGKAASRKALVPVVSAPNSKRVLENVAWLLGVSGPMEVTLLHVLEPLAAAETTIMWTGPTGVEAAVEQRILEEAQDMLDQAETFLTERGVAPFAITKRLESTPSGVARTILKMAGEEAFGTIIIGRRGISRARQFLFGSVSNKVVQHARDMAVWVIS